LGWFLICFWFELILFFFPRHDEPVDSPPHTRTHAHTLTDHLLLILARVLCALGSSTPDDELLALTNLESAQTDLSLARRTFAELSGKMELMGVPVDALADVNEETFCAIFLFFFFFLFFFWFFGFWFLERIIALLFSLLFFFKTPLHSTVAHIVDLAVTGKLVSRKARSRSSKSKKRGGVNQK
jgi:hypothetical protein